MRRVMVLSCLAIGILPWPALAQSDAPAGSIDPTRLGVSIERIRRELKETSTETRTDSGLKLDFRIEVFGQAPPIDIIGPFDVEHGPVPGSAPSHRDVVEFLTPEEFKAPAASFSTLVFWAADKLAQRTKRQRCEDEIARYRAQVLSGMNVSAPSCAQ
jgi:hypothetical protein